MYLDMVVDRPEVFDSAEGSDKTEIVLPLVSLLIFEKPERPAEMECDARILVSVITCFEGDV